MTDTLEIAQTRLAARHACGLWAGLLGKRRSLLVRAAYQRAMIALDTGDSATAVVAVADMAVYALNAVQQSSGVAYLGEEITELGLLAWPRGMRSDP